MTEEVRQEGSRRRLFSFDSLSLVEILVFIPVAGILVLWLIPKWFDIQWSCVSGSGQEGNSAGDVFSNTLGVLGTFGWIVILIGVLYAHIAERPRLAAVLPALWFVLLVGGAAVAAAAIGPSPCPS